MKNRWLMVFILCTSIHASLFSQETSAKESLALRRIAEYWKEGEFTTVKSQIKTFLAEYPESAHAGSLNAMLGDLYFREKNYADALHAYDLISTEPFLQKTQFNHLYCLYELHLFEDVVTFATAFLKEEKKSKTQERAARFQLADALFRLGTASNHSSTKEELYKQALQHFDMLTKTDYEEQILYPSAIICSSLKEWTRAASLFKTLSSQYPDQKEVFLFQAATLELNVDKNAAINTFGEIYLLNGPHAGKAAYNQLQLLFEQKRYRDLLLAQEKALQYIPSEQLNTVRYYIGKSLFTLNDYEHAITHLLQFVDHNPTDMQLLKNAHLSLVLCAKETNDMPLFDQSLKALTNSFPHENETAQAILLHAQTCKESGEFQRAQNDLQTLIDRFPNHTDKETFFFERALLFSLAHEWADSSKAFTFFLANYPNSRSKTDAYRHLIAAQIEETKSASSELKKIKKENLIETLTSSLQEKEMFSQNEKKQIHFLLGKTLFEIGNHEKALTELKSYTETFADDPLCAEAHLLIAYCYAKDLTQPKDFIHHAEKAVALSKNPPKNLRTQLYNAYLILAKDANADEKLALVDKAANHLFLLLDQGIKNENRQWLANHYFQRYQQCSLREKSFYSIRAIAVLESLLTSADKSAMEIEVIRLGQLYAESQRHSDAISLMVSLNKEQQAHPDFEWRYQRLTLFELGRLYEEIGDTAEAIRTYDSLISTSTHSNSYFGIAAKLKKSKLAYSLLTSEQKKEGNNPLQAIYDQLKDLEIQRKLATEPWHLEAALTYIEIKTALASDDNKLSLELFLISQILDNFSSATNSRVQRYLAAAEQFPEQFAIYQDYMQFLKIEQLRLKTLSSQNPGFNALQQVETQYKELLQQPIHNLLKQRIQQRLDEITQSPSNLQSSLTESNV